MFSNFVVNVGRFCYAKLAANDSKIWGKLKEGVILTGLSDLKEGVLRSVLLWGRSVRSFWLDHLRTPWHQKWKYWRHQIFLMGAGDGSSWRLPSCCDSLVGLMWLEYLRVLLICLTQFSSRNQSNIWPIFGWVHGDFWHWPFCHFHGLFHSDDGAPLGGPDRSTAHW